MTRVLIQCVVVLYKQSPAESKALSSLLKACGEDAELASSMAILIQDNSPSAQEFSPGIAQGRYPVPAKYYHAPGNPGLAGAYNRALADAREEKIPWLLLLDQDTCLDHPFLTKLRVALQQAARECCALVPQLVQGDLVLSPQVVGKVFYSRMPLGFSGVASKRLVAFNSAACIRVESLVEIGGFPTQFWLDYLDHMVFHSLQQAGGRIFVLDSQLEHSLSLASIEENVSLERYANVLRAEWMFVRATGWGGGPLVHRVRLLKRTMSHTLKLRDKRYATSTLRSVFS